MITDKKIAIARARLLIQDKTIWAHQARDSNFADCVGAVTYAYDYRDAIPAYPAQPLNGELERELERVMGEPIKFKPVRYIDLMEGDVVSIQFRGPARHVALVALYPLDHTHFSLIHSIPSVGRVVEHILDDKWLSRIEKVFRP